MILDILNIIPGKKRATSGGWQAFNAICCHHRGHKPDTKMRGGIIVNDEDTWTAHCFNCGFKCGAQPGKQFSRNTKSFLEWCGIDRQQIDRWSFQNYANRELHQIDDNKPIIISFNKTYLPEESVPLDPENPQHLPYVQYLATRGLPPTSHPYHVTPDSGGRDKNRIIIPYYYRGEVVGHTSRYYEGNGPKYISEQQAGYVFNVDAQPKTSQVCILVEGQFDAISIGGCAILGNEISDAQAKVLAKLRRTMIVVPDRDKAGMNICTRALDLGYKVSIPEWDSEIKDVNDAVRRYGRLPTLLSILDSASSSRITVEMKRKKFTK